MAATARSGKAKRANESGIKRSAGGRFAKGTACPNESPGRPKEYRGFKLECQEWIRTEGTARLFAIAADAESRDQFNAIKLILAYGLGNPAQTQDAPSAPSAITVRLVDAKAQPDDDD